MNPLKIRRLTDITQDEERTRRSIRTRLNQEDNYAEACKTCPKPLWFTAFFDGTGNNSSVDGFPSIDAAKVKYSNITKLGMFAHPPDKDAPRLVYSAYIQGVGTPCAEVDDTGKGIDKAIGMAAAGKGQARIDKMLEKLEEAVKKNWPFVSQINLAVFGFSRGATQARAFVRQLEKKLAYAQGNQLFWKAANGNNKQPEVVIYFMGLMDTVASIGFGGSRSESVAKAVVPGAVTVFVPFVGIILGPAAGGVLHAVDEGGHAEWANDLAIPAYVRKCVHYVAGHEAREKFPSDSVRRDQEMPANCVETVYPGMHSDVGGGYAPADPASQEGRSNELARIPLCHMYIEAYKAGVPFKAPAEVLATAGALFEISPELERVFDVYMDGAPEGGALESTIIWHMNRYYEWRESRRRRLKDGRLKPPGGVDPFMAVTDAEWEKDVVNVAENRTGWIKTNSYPHEQAMFDAYKRKLVGAMQPAQRADFDLFFDRYMHDSIAGFKKQMRDESRALAMTELSRWSVNRQIFMGKRGKQFLYWRYEGWLPEHGGTKVAIREDANSTRMA